MIGVTPHPPKVTRPIQGGRVAAIVILLTTLALVLTNELPPAHIEIPRSVVLVTCLAFVIGIAQMFLPCGPNASIGVCYPFDRKYPSVSGVAVRMVILTSAAITGSVLSGIVLAASGRYLLGLAPAEADFLIAASCLAFGIFSFLPIRHRIPQFDRETPPPWTRSRSYEWAAVDGAMLGLGWLTRIQYVAWFAIPVAAFLCGDIVLGGLIFGGYGAGRMLGTWIIPALGRMGDVPGGDNSAKYLSKIELANVVTGYISCYVGVVLFLHLV